MWEAGGKCGGGGGEQTQQKKQKKTEGCDLLLMLIKSWRKWKKSVYTHRDKENTEVKIEKNDIRK